MPGQENIQTRISLVQIQSIMHPHCCRSEQITLKEIIALKKKGRIKQQTIAGLLCFLVPVYVEVLWYSCQLSLYSSQLMSTFHFNAEKLYKAERCLKWQTWGVSFSVLCLYAHLSSQETQAVSLGLQSSHQDSAELLLQQRRGRRALICPCPPVPSVLHPVSPWTLVRQSQHMVMGKHHLFLLINTQPCYWNAALRCSLAVKLILG